MDKERIKEYIRNIEQIEEDSIQLFKLVPLKPAESIKNADLGESLLILRWFPDENAKKISRDLKRRYESWYFATLKLIQEYLPYQEKDFTKVYEIMISYVTLNRYATTTEQILSKVEQQYDKGFVDIYLNEFSEVIDNQANLIRSLLYLPEQTLIPAYRCFLTGIACANPLRENPSLVFVVMPFDKSFDDIYQIGIKETVKSLSLQCQRSDEIIHTQNVICTAICQPIRVARYIIVDITGKNPNVFYELGLTHARVEDTDQINKRVIIITRDIDDIPFDLRNMSIIHYDSIGSLRAKLKDVLIGLMSQQHSNSNGEK